LPSYTTRSKRQSRAESRNQPATVGLLRSINRAAVLDTIRRYSPISRSEIAQRLGLSLPTVMRIVDGLQAEDLVRNGGKGESTGGRPSPLLEFNGNAYAVVGADLGGSRMYGTVADLSGNIQYEVYLPRSSDHVQQLFRLLDDLLAAPRPDGQQVRGIAVGVPGITRAREGVVTYAPSLSWRELPLASLLSEHYDLPVFIENDVNLAALGEMSFGAGQGARDLIAVTVGIGIGAGVIIGGAIYRGHNQAAGEIGYLLPSLQALGKRYDEFGAFEAQASCLGLAERARRAAAERGLVQANASFASNLTAEDVYAAARQGEAWARQAVAETADLLALAIANMAALLNPEVVILGGSVSGAGDLLIEPIIARLQGVVPFPPRVVASQLGYRATAMGAIMLVLGATSEFFVVSRVP